MENALFKKYKFLNFQLTPENTFILSSSFAITSGTLSIIPITWFILTHSSSHDLAVILSSRAIISFLGAPLAMSLIDISRVNKILVFSTLISTILLFLQFIIIYIDFFNISILIILQCISGFLMSVVLPVRQSMLAEYVSAQELEKKIGLQRGLESFGRFIGPMIASGIILLFDITIASLAGALLMAISTFLVITLPSIIIDTANNLTPQLKINWLKNSYKIFALKMSIPPERIIMIGGFIINSVSFSAIGLLLPMRIQSIDGHLAWLGITYAGFGLGSTIGGLYISNYLNNRFGSLFSSLFCVASSGVMFAFIGIFDNIYIICICLTFGGIFITSGGVIGAGRRILATPKKYRATFASISNVAVNLASIISPILSVFIAEYIGINNAYISFGVLTLIVSSSFLVSQNYRRLFTIPLDKIHKFYDIAYGLKSKAASYKL